MFHSMKLCYNIFYKYFDGKLSLTAPYSVPLYPETTACFSVVDVALILAALQKQKWKIPVESHEKIQICKLKYVALPAMVTTVNKGVAEISFKIDYIRPHKCHIRACGAKKTHSLQTYFIFHRQCSFVSTFFLQNWGLSQFSRWVGSGHAASLCPTQVWLLMFLVTLCMFLHQESLQSEFTLIAPKDHTHLQKQAQQLVDTTGKLLWLFPGLLGVHLEDACTAFSPCSIIIVEWSKWRVHMRMSLQSLAFILWWHKFMLPRPKGTLANL